MRISPKLLYFACRWLETTDRIREPARGTPERAELVAAFRSYVTKTEAAGGR